MPYRRRGGKTDMEGKWGVKRFKQEGKQRDWRDEGFGGQLTKTNGV